MLMQITVKKEETINVAFLQVSAGVRYWEDATVNGTKDTDGDLIPFRVGEYWKPKINTALRLTFTTKSAMMAFILYLMKAVQKLWQKTDMCRTLCVQKAKVMVITSL